MWHINKMASCCSVKILRRENCNMKKKSKYIAAAALSLAMAGSCVIGAYAWSTSTWATAAPSGYAGEWADSSVDKTVTTSSSPAKGSNVYTYFKNYKKLPNGFVSNNGRTLEVWAMEDDPGSGDEHFKTYAGKFSGVTVTDFVLVRTDISGMIEPTYDLELYTRQRVGKISGDTVTKHGSLYSFYFSAD